MRNLLLAYVFTMIPMAIFDALWLGTMVPRLYMPRIGHLMSGSPQWGAAILFYLMYVAGALYFIVWPGITADTGLMQIACRGALLGLLAYGTYDLTNQATLQNWPVFITVADMLWGGFLTGTVSVLAVYFYRLFVR